LPEVVHRRWLVAANGGPPPTSGTGSTQQAWFGLECGQCLTKIQIKTACKRGESAFRCRVHNSKGNEQRGLGALQRAALVVLQGTPGVGHISVEQYRALGVAQKPFDFVLEDWSILIEVDGSQHAAGSTGFSTGFGQPAGAQHERDREVDRGVLRSGLRLLRLHHADAHHWGKHVLAAITRVQHAPQCSFVYYSASYPASSRVCTTSAAPL
jgi:very-short-patch-repair endonuclease